MNTEAAIAPYSSLCYRFCTSFEPKPQEIVMALFTKEESLAYHEEPRPGKLEVLPVKPCFTQKDLSMAYSPGVANACLAIADDPSLANAYTGRGNLVAVVSNGTAVLGLGNIGPLAGKPVMEGKSVLFKAFADVNAYDINLALTDPDKIIEVVKALEPTFGGINLEDIKAPECFYIEEVLKKEMNIPVFHDDQHGTAIVVTAALLGALRVVKKEIGAIRVVVNGPGAAGTAIIKMLLAAGVRVMGTGRSDYPNQINNVLAFPGVFKGALSVRARDINSAMKVAAAHAIADLVSDEERNEDYIIPGAFDARVAQAVADAVARAARESGVARL